MPQMTINLHFFMEQSKLISIDMLSFRLEIHTTKVCDLHNFIPWSGDLWLIMPY